MRRILLWSVLWAGAAMAAPVDDAKRAEAAGDAAAAVDAWRRAVEAAPEDAAGYEGLGRVLLRAGRNDEAVETFRQLCAKVPGYARGPYRLAFALRKDGRYDEAAAAYRAYIERAPDDPDGRFGLAETLRQLGDRDGALAEYREYVRLESRPSEAKWVQRAREAIGELEASAAAAVPPPERPLEPAPVPAPASTPAAAPTDDPEARFAARDYAGARRGYEALLLRSPESATLAYQAGVAAALSGDAAAAERHAGRAALLDPGNPAAADLARLAHAQRRPSMMPPPTPADAEAALADGRLRTAERLAAAALAAGPETATRARLERTRGRALLALGRGVDALGALKTAAGLGAADPALWNDLAAAAALSGDAAAQRYFEGLKP